MNNALETGPNDTPMTVGVKSGVAVIAPNLTAKGIDNGTAEDAPSAEGHGAGGSVYEHLCAIADDIDQSATVGSDVFYCGTGFFSKPSPLQANEVIGREDHVPIGYTSQFKSRVELRAHGKVRHLNIPDAVLVKEVDIELIPRTDGGTDLPDAP